MEITTDDSIPLKLKRIRNLVLFLGIIIIWSFNIFFFLNLKKEIETPVIITETKIIKVEVIKEIEKPTSSIIENILNKVFILESSGGLHDSCRRQGKFNGYGYLSNKICFDTQEEAKKVVASWFEKHLKNKNLPQSLCYYQSGIALNDCRYYQKYLTI